MLREPTQIEWARLAAYIDGEGSIIVDNYHVKGKPTWNPRATLHVVVTNSDPRLVVWCRDVFGGYITNRERKVRKCYSKRPLFSWKLCAARAEYVLLNCMPYFVLKHNQAKLALAVRATYPKRKYGRWEGGVPREVIEQRNELIQRLKDEKREIPPEAYALLDSPKLLIQ